MPLEQALQYRGKFPDPGPWKQVTPIKLEPKGYIGVDVVPKQYINRLKKRPYVLNIMVCGESGLGKTSMINTLFNTDLVPVNEQFPLTTKTVQIEERQFELTEGIVTLKVSVIDTPGFGDVLDRTKDLDIVTQYIDEQHKSFLEAERFKNFRALVRDMRVHVLLYFLSPTGGALRALDLNAMTELSKRVNVIPVIGKADALTFEERLIFKEKILSACKKRNIKLYPNDLAEDKSTISHLEPHVPFAVISSNRIVERSGKRIRVRAYRWGVIDIENEQHCDFVFLRELIMSRNLQDLIQTTNDTHYSNYRAAYLRAAAASQLGTQRRDSLLLCDDDYMARVDIARQQFFEESKLRETEMKNNFIVRVREKEAELREQEEQINRRRDDMYKQYKETQDALRQEMATIDAELAMYPTSEKKSLFKFK